jgi:hypothetical protein
MINKYLNFLNFNFWIYKFKNLFNEIKIIDDLNTKNIIIMDHFNVIKAFLFRSFLIFCLKKKHNARILVFNYKFNFLFKKLYHFIGVNFFFKHNISFLKKNDLKKKSIKIFNSLKSNNDLLKLKIDNIHIGIDIYESYLRNFNLPTVDIKDYKLLKLIYRYFFLKDQWDFLLNKFNLKAVIISHRNYLDFNLLCKICYQRNIPVYTVTGDGTRYTRFYKDDLAFTKNYSLIFNKLSKIEKIKAILFSKKRLKLRFEGKVGIDMSYSTKSAFIKYNSKKIIVKKKKKISVLICTHCFYDNPHAYKGMLFYDFYDWIKYLGVLSYKTNYDWYIKVHPDYLPGTLEIIKVLSKNFKNIKILDPNISFHELAYFIDYALTCYGSVGHELPLLNINVINADIYNPHCSFNFNFTPKSKKQYAKLILNLDKRPSKLKYKEDIYKFYYIHNYYFSNFKLFFNSKKNYDKFNSIKNDKNYLFFYKKFMRSNIKSIILKVDKFLNKDEKFSLPSSKLKVLNNFF